MPLNFPLASAVSLPSPPVQCSAPNLPDARAQARTVAPRPSGRARHAATACGAMSVKPFLGNCSDSRAAANNSTPAEPNATQCVP